MATALELCAQLGFLDTSYKGPSEGPPKVQLDDMKGYVKHHWFVEDAALLADAYLYVAHVDEKHWAGAASLQLGHSPSLLWDVDNRRRVQPISHGLEATWTSPRERLQAAVEQASQSHTRGCKALYA